MTDFDISFYEMLKTIKFKRTSVLSGVVSNEEKTGEFSRFFTICLDSVRSLCSLDVGDKLSSYKSKAVSHSLRQKFLCASFLN